VATNRIDDESPLHTQIRAALLAEIRSGRLSPGDQLPTESDLRDRFGVSRTTVRRALHDLALSGLIARQPGRGTFVADPHIDQTLERLTGFVEDVAAAGFQARAEVLGVDEVRADRRVADALQLHIGEKAICIKRLRLANFQPLSLDVSYFRVELGERLAGEDLEINPFYSLLEQQYGMILGEAEYVLEARTADEATARSLRMTAGGPILWIERTTYLKLVPEPLMFEYLQYRGDRIRYRLRLERQQSRSEDGE